MLYTYTSPSLRTLEMIDEIIKGSHLFEPHVHPASAVHARCYVWKDSISNTVKGEAELESFATCVYRLHRYTGVKRTAEAAREFSSLKAGLQYLCFLSATLSPQGVSILSHIPDSPEMKEAEDLQVLLNHLQHLGLRSDMDDVTLFNLNSIFSQ